MRPARKGWPVNNTMRFSALVTLTTLLCICGCSQEQQEYVQKQENVQVRQNVLDQDDVVLVETIGTNRITFHRNTAGVDSLRPLIIDRIKLAVTEISRIIDFKDVEFRVMVFPERTLPSKGMSGAAPNTGQIYILLNPEHPRLHKSLDEELVATLAHEYHHTLRHRTVGYGSTLFEAIVSEGLADHFTVEVTGDDPPWATPFAEEDLAYWRAEAEKVWFNHEYDHQAWFIGLNSDIPRGTGYALGRRIILEFLTKHTEESPSTLYTSAAEEFLP